MLAIDVLQPVYGVTMQSERRRWCVDMLKTYMMLRADGQASGGNKNNSRDMQWRSVVYSAIKLRNILP